MIHLIGYGLGFAVVLTIIGLLVALPLPKQLRVFLPKSGSRILALLATLPLPLSALAMAVVPWVPYLNGTHRGPEVVPILITLASLPFVFLIGWPLVFVIIHRRIARTRHPIIGD
ncbi:MAG: hypothetical protein QNJ15_12360 [Erythrobacter sp.]|nr:hypothetical protein [Erythrobacter sp.]